jgi:DNA repair exonuclease SbcCD ATPase subunit
MSFQRPSSSTVNDDIQKFKTDLDKLRNLNVSDPAVRRTFNRTVDELRKRAEVIEAKISGDSKAAQLRAEFNPLKIEFDRVRGAHQLGTDETKNPLKERPPPDGVIQAQIQREIEAEEHLRFLKEQTEDIVEKMKTLNEITGQVNQVVQKDHDTILRIEGTTEEAKVNMTKGNQELEKAEGHQKKTWGFF